MLDSHPTLQVSFVESGGSWLPAVMERMDEAQRQYGTWFLRPQLPMLPSEYVKRQVHVSFQHGRNVLSVLDICGLDALMWGSDYPHLEGTYPNTKQVLDSIFEGVSDAVRRAITGDNFAKLFRVPEPSEVTADRGSPARDGCTTERHDSEDAAEAVDEFFRRDRRAGRARVLPLDHPAAEALDPVAVDAQHLPVSQPAASEARYTTTGEAFAGSIASKPEAGSAGPMLVPAVMRVAAMGEMAFAVTPYRLISRAAMVVRETMPAFAAP